MGITDEMNEAGESGQKSAGTAKLMALSTPTNNKNAPST